MPNLGPAELIIILAIALIVFGPKKLPEIGKGIGNALREFNKARNDFMESIQAETDRDEPARSVSASSTYDDGADDDDLTPTSERKVEFPEPLAPDDVDALPYGSAFNATEGDSQPSFRTADPEPAPVSAAAAAPAGTAVAEREA